MELIDRVKLLYPDFGTKDIAKMLRVRQTTIKKIVDDNNFKLIKNRRINIEISINVKCGLVRFTSKKTGYSQLRVTNKNDIKRIGDFVYLTIEDDNIGLKRKYEKYKQIVSSLVENDELVEYIKKK